MIQSFWNGYGSNPNRVARLQQQNQQNLESAQSAFGLRMQSEEYERQKKFQPQEDELRNLDLQFKKSQIQSKMAFQPQMEAIRGGIMSRMAGRLGIGSPTSSMGGRHYGSSPSLGGGSFSNLGMGSIPTFGSSTSGSTSGYVPLWMQNYQVPQFPR